MPNKQLTDNPIRNWGLLPITLAFFFFLVVLVCTALVSYRETKSEIISDIDKRLFVGAACIKHILPRDFHDRTENLDSISPEEDNHNIKVLSEFTNRTGFKFLYTLIKKDGKIYITSSSATAEELAANEEVKYFTVFDEAMTNFFKAFDNREPISFTHEDRWGVFRAAILSEGSPDGRQYLAVAEHDISYINEVLKTETIKTMAGAGILILGALPLFFFFLRRERRNLEEKRDLEDRIQQAQKMESIGNLAGGIAHDFNNILTPIVGIAELLLDDLPPGSLTHENAQEILKAGRRGSELIKQILSFSCQSKQRKIPVRLQQILKEVLKLSRATIPSNIEIRSDIQSECGLIQADPTQLHQIMMNLITNAYHAVEDAGGEIWVRLKETELGLDNPAGEPREQGTYAMLTVSDDGHGIDPSLIGRIFEPYFTTKPQGKGTGLGLSVVLGIVKQYGGDIRVSSEAGKGTTVNVYLPLLNENMETEIKTEGGKPETGTERILLVDDEEPIARLGQLLLERLGYQVTAQTSSVEALETFRTNPDWFDLVITDMNMPHLTGDQLAAEIASINPCIPVILCTGFSAKIDEAKAKKVGIKGFLMKPVVKSEMAKMVRAVLDEAKG